MPRSVRCFGDGSLREWDASTVPTNPPRPSWRDRAYDLLTYNAPLSPDRAQRLVRLLLERAPADALDLGCGWATLLLEVLAASPSMRGTGLDTDDDALARARRDADVRGLGGRATFVGRAATEPAGVADLVLCVGASHAFGGQAQCLAALRRQVSPGGRVLLGDGFWDGHPDQHLLHTFGPMAGLGGLTDLAVDAGFRIRHASTSSLDEWDAFESDWRAGMEATGEPDALAFCDERRHEYLGGYRGVLGFAWLVLDPA
jgi:SAM-dependent methyltransferase